MKQKDVVVGMDVGTSHVRVVVGEHRSDGTINIIGVGLSPSEGLKKGFVVDIDKTIESINKAVDEAERMAGVKIESAFVSLVGLDVQLQQNRGVVAVTSEDREIRPQDVHRAIEATRVIAIPAEREIVDIIAHEFIVDGYDGIKDPVGMLGVRLEVEAMLVTAPSTCLQNLIRCVRKSGIDVSGVVLKSFANGEVCLNRDEKELGVFIIDIGGGTTEIGYYKNGILQDISVIPVGGFHITNDLAYGLHTSFYAAENLKIEFGYAMQSMADDNHEIEVVTVGGKDKQKVTERELASYMVPRVQEILQLARNEMFQLGGSEALAANVVITGGVALMDGMVEVSENILGTSVRVGEPKLVGVQSPIFTTSVGIIYYVIANHLSEGNVSERKESRKRNKPRKKGGSGGSKESPGFWKKIADWFNEFFE